MADANLKHCKAEIFIKIVQSNSKILTEIFKFENIDDLSHEI